MKQDSYNAKEFDKIAEALKAGKREVEALGRTIQRAEMPLFLALIPQWGYDGCVSDELREAVHEAYSGRPQGYLGYTLGIEDGVEGGENWGEGCALVISLTSPSAIVPDEVALIGYYEDGGQTIIDVLDDETTVVDWAKGWDDDGTLPEFLRVVA